MCSANEQYTNMYYTCSLRKFNYYFRFLAVLLLLFFTATFGALFFALFGADLATFFAAGLADFTAGFTTLLAVAFGADFFVDGTTIHSSLSEVKSPPSPTIIKSSGQKLKNSRGNKSKIAAMKTSPITTSEAGQNTFFGIYPFL